MSEQVAAAKAGERAAEGGVLVKLVLVAASLAIVPVTTFFGTQKFLWNGDSTFAAISAVFAANIVLVVYILQSIREDRRETKSATEKPESKKSQ